MGIATEIMTALPDEISTVTVFKDTTLHGETATEVAVNLVSGQKVTGVFTNNPKSSFGGVQFAGPKNVSHLMIAKIRSVLNDTHEK